MAKRSKPTARNRIDLLPPLPLDAAQWEMIFDFLGLSPKQAEITRLLLRSGARRQIAEALNISEPTLKTHLDRIYARTGASDPMQLAMRVLAVSHQVKAEQRCRPYG
ncbi:MAG: helix-turn-helix transcriptional regulator [Nitrosotalea sp.]